MTEKVSTEIALTHLCCSERKLSDIERSRCESARLSDTAARDGGKLRQRTSDVADAT